MIRIGRTGSRKEGYRTIEPTTRSRPWGALGPYVAETKYGVIMENAWQFRKVYKDVPKRTERYSRWDQTIVWQWPAEHHADVLRSFTKASPNEMFDVQTTDEYWIWREAGLNNKYPVRYPAGIKNRHNALGFITDDNELLDYVEARYEYIDMYIEAINTNTGTDSKGRSSRKRLDDLIKLYQKGNNILIVEPDGPHLELLDYYIEKYGVEEDFIDEDGTMLINKENCDIMFNDTKKPYGHGYVLGFYLNESD